MESPLGGVFYDAPEDWRLADAIARLERIEAHISPRELQAHVARFGEARFAKEMREVIEPGPMNE